jgi:hypothetical protein
MLSLEELHFRLSAHPAGGFKNRGTLVEELRRRRRL